MAGLVEELGLVHEMKRVDFTWERYKMTLPRTPARTTGRWTSKTVGLLIACGLLSALALAQPQGQSASTAKTAPAAQEKNPPSKPEPSESDYVGSETCKTCHADV